jgi:predicted ABC-class ATPase
LIRRGYEVAERHHRGQTRKSGEAYITHPLAVAQILAELGMDTTTLVAALLHDTVEDTPYTIPELYEDFGGEVARLVLENAIVRAASRAIDELAGPTAAAAPGSGRVWIDPPGRGLLNRTSARVGDESLDVALAFDLPAAARRVRGRQAETILFDHLPRLGMAALLFPLRRINDVKAHVESVVRRTEAVQMLAAHGLVALVPPAALLGRSIPAPARKTIETDHGPVSGLVIPSGITLFMSDGVSGTGAWLRELVAAAGTASRETAIIAGPVATIRASRRSFGPIDLRAFVRACPEVPEPEAYVSGDAPVPLALAASVVEAIEAGARILVLDEDDIPAGAFGRAGRMQRVLGGESPPYVTVNERLADLRDRWGVSVLVAARATGDLFENADAVFVLREDLVEDRTAAIRKSTRTTADAWADPSRPSAEHPAPRSMRVATEGAPGALQVANWGVRGVRVGEDLVDLSDTTLVGDSARLRAIAALLKRAASDASDWRPLGEVLDLLEAASARHVLDRLEEPGLLDLARPSRIEIMSALVRWKRVTFRVGPGTLRPPPR